MRRPAAEAADAPTVSRETTFTERRVKKDRAGLKAASTKRTSLRAGFGVGVPGGPVFGRESDVPEVGIGEEKLDAHFDLLVGKFIDVGDDALERVFRLRV